MLLILKTGDETGDSIALRLDLLKGVELDTLLETAVVVTGSRDPNSSKAWVAQPGARVTCEVVDEHEDVNMEPF